MVILQHAGASKVGFITDPLPEPRHIAGADAPLRMQRPERSLGVDCAVGAAARRAGGALWCTAGWRSAAPPAPHPTLAIEATVVDSRTVKGARPATAAGAATRRPQPRAEPPAPPTPEEALGRRRSRHPRSWRSREEQRRQAAARQAADEQRRSPGAGRARPKRSARRRSSARPKRSSGRRRSAPRRSARRGPPPRRRKRADEQQAQRRRTTSARPTCSAASRPRSTPTRRAQAAAAGQLGGADRGQDQRAWLRPPSARARA